MTDSTQSGSDTNVTSKDTPTGIETRSIKGTQAEHMNNSSQSTPYAQWSAQVELDDMPDMSDTHMLIGVTGFGKVWAVKDIATYYDTWLDWHNKQVLEIIGDDQSQKRPEGGKYTAQWTNGRNNIRQQQRNKLKEMIHG